MNLYLKIEILARELEGRLLLALVAAERGHRVLLGDLTALLSHRLWLPPGIFHDKSLTPSASKMAFHTRLREHGFLVTSQDEEHGLLDEFGTWADFAARRFSDASLDNAARCFMWGPHDHATLTSLHPRHAERIVRTGSPRVDLWRPDLADFYADRELPGIDPSRPYVLFAHQGAIVMDHNPLWQRIADQRPRYFRGDDDEREWGWYQRCVGEVHYLEHLIPAIRAVARANPDAQLVIRPHPLDAEGSWRALVGELPNLVITREGTASAWLRRAHLVVHNGSTVGFEAAAADVPLVSFQPVDDRDGYVSNRLGRAAHTRDELLDLVRTALRRERPDGGWHAPGGVLAERLGTLSGPLAADRIVDEWERIAPAIADAPAFDAARATRIANAHRALGRVRIALREGPRGPGFVTGHKFSTLPFDQVLAIADDLRRTLGRFDRVRIVRRGRRLVEVTPR